MKKIKSFFALIVISGMLFVPINSFAVVDKAAVATAEKYLNGITGLIGEFKQTANGKKESGTFSMLRPGRVRLDYKTSKIQLISDGVDLYFFDRGLDQITTIPLTSTPAGILVRKTIDLQNADIVVSDVVKTDKTFSLKLHLKGNEGLGSMIMTFNNFPVLLNSWTVLDATGAKTDVAFSGLKVKTDFPKNYFQIQRHKTVSAAGGDSYYE